MNNIKYKHIKFKECNYKHATHFVVTNKTLLTTAVACENTNRQYIVIEQEEYILKGINRLTKPYNYFSY